MPYIMLHSTQNRHFMHRRSSPKICRSTPLVKVESPHSKVFRPMHIETYTLRTGSTCVVIKIGHFTHMFSVQSDIKTVDRVIQDNNYAFNVLIAPTPHDICDVIRNTIKKQC